MKKTLIALTLILVSAAAHAAKLEDLKWMTGSWRSTSPAGVYDNVFTEPTGGLILGLAKLVDSNSQQVSFYEYDQIKLTDKGLVLSPMPFSQPGVSFTSTEVSAGRVVFENPDHEFPRKITYELNASGQFVSTVEGTQNGQPVKMQFVMQKN